MMMLISCLKAFYHPTSYTKLEHRMPHRPDPHCCIHLMLGGHPDIYTHTALGNILLLVDTWSYLVEERVHDLHR